MSAEAIAGFPGGVDNKQMMVDAKLRKIRSSSITISNGATSGLVHVVFPSTARPFAVSRAIIVPDGIAISNHATGSIKIGTVADDDALVAVTALQNILANVETVLTRAATLVGAGAAYAWAQGNPVVPKDTKLIGTVTEMAAGGTGRLFVELEGWFGDETSA